MRNISKLTVFLFAIAVAFAHSISAENLPLEEEGSEREPAQMVPAPGLKKKKLRTRPRTNSIYRTTDADDAPEETEEAQEAVSSESVRAWDLKLGLLGGYAVTLTSDATNQLAWTQGGYNQNYYLGAEADFRFAEYFGVEGEAFYNIAPQSTATSTVTSMSLRQLGYMAGAKVMYPILFVGTAIKLIPKVGASFGALGLNQTTQIGAGSTSYSFSNIQTSGIIGFGGLELVLADWIVLGADYALSFGTSGTQEAGSVSGSVATVPTTVTSLSTPSFQRVRVNASLLVSDMFFVGAQYTFRMMSYASVSLGSTSLYFHQFMGMVGIII